MKNELEEILVDAEERATELETFTRAIYQDAGIEPELAERLFAKGYRREAP